MKATAAFVIQLLFMFKRIDKLKIDKQYRRKISFASMLKQVLF